jgi:peptidoglycan lytic transglycosylase
MRPQVILRAAAGAVALGVPALAALAPAGAPAVHPSGAQAAQAGSRPSAGDVRVARSRLNVVAGRRALVSGRVDPAGAGRRVALQRRAGGAWHTIDRTTTAGNGVFAFRFRPQQPGSAPVRLRSGGAREHLGRLNVYRRALASWYGPGLYGGRLGCGGTLTPGTVGVAHKTLPCGAKVTLRHGGRTVRVPVVDRGPYAGGREFDLTAATKGRLGFSGARSILVAA